ncbi:hypothetical protein GCM10010371_57810 [Streptomyces subrutilus]|uniref:DUF1295 domain-containing protein n=2 Tax=Streptomyces subrutilus TaxID=36818 RepID=A0A918R954_9ACTN|nr:hypothetical protein GCM10010371_57810 [Streptomyces subrutilus]
MNWDGFGLNLAVAAAAALGVMLAAFAVGVRTGRHRGVDVAWGLAFAAVALATYGMSGAGGGRALLLTVLTVVWGVRLGGHIAWRGRGHGEDPRYDRMLNRAPGNRNAYALRKVYLLQGALVWLVSLPVQAGAYAPDGLGPLAVAGTVLWLTGLTFEAVGDHQLARFKADPSRRGRIMDRGLWSWTRHPNYFGDFCVWWGIFLVAAGSWEAAAVSVVSPLFMSYLLTAGSGKRLLERHMEGRPGYAEYRARTSGFFPRPPRRGAGASD